MIRVDLLLLLLAMMYSQYHGTVSPFMAVIVTILVMDMVMWVYSRCAYSTLTIIASALLHACMTQSFVSIITCIASFLMIELMLKLFAPPPRVVNLSVPYTSTSHADTQAYARTIANLMVNYQRQGKKGVIRLVGNRGAGKSAIVSEILRFITCNPTATDFGAITFIGVKVYVVDIDGVLVTIVHIDPDVKGHQRLITMHTPLWDFMIIEHGDRPVFREHNTFIKKMGDAVVDTTVDISQNIDTGVRTFTMTSNAGKPVETPPTLKWNGRLIEKRFSPDIRPTNEQCRNICNSIQSNTLSVMAVDATCDDTCVIIRDGDVVIYIMQKQCIQTGQLAGKEGVDPLETARFHELHFNEALQAIRAMFNGDYTHATEKGKEYLQKHGLKIDIIAVTQGPGQPAALARGVSFATSLAKELNVPVMTCDHIEGHGLSALLSPPEEAPQYPYLVFVVSGGHTVLLLVLSAINIRYVYSSPEDAIGELFDKVGRAIGITVTPAGLAVERKMNTFLGGRHDLWADITSKTTDDDIIKRSSDPETQKVLFRFRSMMQKLESCQTPSALKAVLCESIKKEKHDASSRIDLLATWIKYFNPTISDNELIKIATALFGKSWMDSVWKKPKSPSSTEQTFLSKVKAADGDKYKDVAHETLIVRLLQVLEDILVTKNDIQDPFAFLHAFLKHFNLLDKVTERDIVYLCRAFTKYAEIPYSATDILDRIKDTPPCHEYISCMQSINMPNMPFSTFLRNFEDMTHLPDDEQAFYCALLHASVFKFLSFHFLEAIARFSFVMHLCMAGGVACNRYLQSKLKILVENCGRRFTIVPREFCADNAHMIGILAIERLKHCNANAGKCICNDDVGICQSCNLLCEKLFSQGLGNVSGSCEVDDVRQCSWDNWRGGEATHKKVPGIDNIYKPIGYVPKQDDEISIKDMCDLLNNSKNGSNGTPLFKVRNVFNTKWASSCDPFVEKWLELKSTTELMKIQPIVTHKFNAIVLLVKTNFFGYGYDAFAQGLGENNAAEHLHDVNHILSLLRP